ncbi:MAG TPA: hypothetical protein VHV31_01840, partial [Nitrolancea sp.]|nr:hypothetical protein [Nitrolancea sp.]
MSIRRLSVWGLPSLFLLIVGVILIVFNLVNSHLGEVAFTIGLLVVGGGAMLYGMTESRLNADIAEANPEMPNRSADAPNQDSVATRRGDWLSLGVIAGFTGTTILTVGLMFSYEIARIIGSSSAGASVFENWLWSLTHNPATDTAR